MVGAGDGAGALAHMAGFGVGAGTLKADAHETAPRDGTSVAPLACALEASVHEGSARYTCSPKLS